MTFNSTPEDSADLFIDLFDREGTGFIYLQNLEATLIANGFVDAKTDILNLLKHLDPKNTGKIPTRDVIQLF